MIKNRLIRHNSLKMNFERAFDPNKHTPLIIEEPKLKIRE
jgi:hypothetical protein